MHGESYPDAAQYAVTPIGPRARRAAKRRFRTIQPGLKDVGAPLRAHSVRQTAILPPWDERREIMMHPHLPSPFPVAVPDIGFAQSISISPKAPDLSGFADVSVDHCGVATRPPDRILWLPSVRPWFAVQS
jgi:hypothetical protein